MGLFVAINQYLTDELLAQLASASALPVAAAHAAAAAAVPLLVRQLTQPVDADELSARWGMCRHLYLSQLLTQPAELLRTDLDWPDRRRHLARKILSDKQVECLADANGQPAHAEAMLGYLTLIALAVVGEQASVAALTPQATGHWLASQQVPSVLPVGGVGWRPPARPAPAVAAGKAKTLAMSVVVGSVTAASLVNGYHWLGYPNEVVLPAAAQATIIVPAVAAPRAEPVVKAPVAAPADSATVAVKALAPPPPAARRPKAVVPAVAPAAGLRDTVGNAALAQQIGGKFSSGAGRYAKGEGQPLIIKLVNRATLTVGINSTESLLYKRLAHPSLPFPANIAVDRLSFDLGQARLGAEGAQQLGNVANLLKTFPKARLVVVGHANNHEAQAIRLGLERAALAVDELVKQGIAADRLQAQGMLSTELPSDNDSAEKQAMLQGITLKISRL